MPDTFVRNMNLCSLLGGPAAKYPGTDCLFRGCMPKQKEKKWLNVRKCP